MLHACHGNHVLGVAMLTCAVLSAKLSVKEANRASPAIALWAAARALAAAKEGCSSELVASAMI